MIEAIVTGAQVEEGKNEWEFIDSTEVFLAGDVLEPPKTRQGEGG